MLGGVIIVVSVICGCAGSDAPVAPVRHDVSAAQLETMMADGAPLVILDVRTTAEYDGGHIPGSINIPVTELAGRLGELDGDSRTACVCGIGARSMQAAQILVDNGFSSVYNLEGGCSAGAVHWSQALCPRARRRDAAATSGRPGHRPAIGPVPQPCSSSPAASRRRTVSVSSP